MIYSQLCAEPPPAAIPSGQVLSNPSLASPPPPSSHFLVSLRTPTTTLDRPRNSTMDAPPKSHSRNIRKNRTLHPCPQCGKAFTKRSNMLIHARLHTGETPYVCKYAGCGRSYKWLSSINFHESRCQHKHMGLAVPAPRPPPPPAAAEAARVAAAAAAAAISNPPTSSVSTSVPSNMTGSHTGHHASHFTPLPPPLPSYHSLHSVTQGRAPSPPPPPPPLRPPPPFAHQHPHHAQLNPHPGAHPSLRPPPSPSPSTPLSSAQPEATSPSHPAGIAMLPGGVFDLPQGGGFPLRPKGKRFRTDFLPNHPNQSSTPHQTSLSQDLLIMHTQPSSPLHPVTQSAIPAPHQMVTPTGIHPRAKKTKVKDTRSSNSTARSDRPITPIKPRVRDGGPGSPESVSSKELREILTPPMNAMLAHASSIEGDARHVMPMGTVNGTPTGHAAMNGGLEAIGESFGLENDILLANCSIGAVFDELAAAGSGVEYSINQLETVGGENGNPIELFQ